MSNEVVILKKKKRKVYHLSSSLTVNAHVWWQGITVTKIIKES